MIQTGRTIFAEEGIRALLQGLQATLLGGANSVVQFAIYE